MWNSEDGSSEMWPKFFSTRLPGLTSTQVSHIVPHVGTLKADLIGVSEVGWVSSPLGRTILVGVTPPASPGGDLDPQRPSAAG